MNLTEKQLKYIALRAEGKSKKDAVLLAGYSEKSNPTVIGKSAESLRSQLLSEMESQGLTSQKLAKKLNEGIDSKKLLVSSYKGKIVEEREIPDNETQHKYVRTALEVRGDLQSDPSVNVNVGLIESPKIDVNPNSWNDTSAENP